MWLRLCVFVCLDMCMYTYCVYQGPFVCVCVCWFLLGFIGWLLLVVVCCCLRTYLYLVLVGVVCCALHAAVLCAFVRFVPDLAVFLYGFVAVVCH